MTSELAVTVLVIGANVIGAVQLLLIEWCRRRMAWRSPPKLKSWTTTNPGAPYPNAPSTQI